MQSDDVRLRRTGYLTFGLSGVCAISSGVIVSLLQDLYGFSFQTTGNLLTCMNIGNMSAAFLAGILPGKLGIKRTILLMGSGYFLGYLLCTAGGNPLLLMLAFLMLGLCKGAVLNTSSVLVGTHTGDKKVSMQLMHSFYALGALLCPFLLNFLGLFGERMPMLGTAVIGLGMWGIFLTLPSGKGAEKEKKAQSGKVFLRDPVFWVLAALLFCQNGAEYGVTGWMVTYYKNQGILQGNLAAYVMTIMWAFTLAGRLLIAFVVPVRNHFKALVMMGAACSVGYILLMMMQAPVPAVLSLAFFSLSMAGTNPMITASLGNRMSPQSMAVILPVGSLGGILVPLLIGQVSEAAGLRAGMGVNLVPCIGILVLGLVAYRMEADPRLKGNVS